MDSTRKALPMMQAQYTPSCGSLLKKLTEQVDTKLQPIIQQYESDKWSKKISTRTHVDIMVSANLAQSKSLSDITAMIASTKRFAFVSLHKSSLSRINEHRDYHIFEDLYTAILQQIRQRIPFGQLRIIDTTTEVVSQILFPFFPYDSTRGAVRFTTVYDPIYELPETIVIGDGKTGDTTLVKEIPIQPGFTYLVDCGFRSYEWYDKIIENNAYFITRQQKSAAYTVIETNEVTEDDVISDQLVILGTDPRWQMKHVTRLIRFIKADGEEMLLSTNRFDLTTQQIRELYRRRWDIEVFFKFIKQHLKLKKFFGTSKNAIKIQIFSALLAYLLAYLLKPKCAKMTDFLRKIRYTLFLEYQQLSFLTDT